MEGVSEDEVNNCSMNSSDISMPKKPRVTIWDEESDTEDPQMADQVE